MHEFDISYDVRFITTHKLHDNCERGGERERMFAHEGLRLLEPKLKQHTNVVIKSIAL